MATFARTALFPGGRCHHRDDEGRPDCKLKRKGSANLCEKHEAEYRSGAYRARRDTALGGAVALKRGSRARAKARAPRASAAAPAPQQARTRRPRARAAGAARKARAVKA